MRQDAYVKQKQPPKYVILHKEYIIFSQANIGKHKVEVCDTEVPQYSSDLILQLQDTNLAITSVLT